MYIPNAFYILDSNDGDDVDIKLLVYDVTNKLYNAKAQTVTLSANKSGITAVMEDSYGDNVETGDAVGQGNLVTLKLTNTSNASIDVTVTLTNATFESGAAATKTRTVTVAAKSTNSISFVVSGTSGATVTIS